MRTTRSENKNTAIYRLLSVKYLVITINQGDLCNYIFAELNNETFSYFDEMSLLK